MRIDWEFIEELEQSIIIATRELAELNEALQSVWEQMAEEETEELIDREDTLKAQIWDLEEEIDEWKGEIEGLKHGYDNDNDEAEYYREVL